MAVVARLWGALQPSRDTFRHRTALAVLLTACFALRLGLAWILPSIHQADEVYQVAEQANRALHGYGIVSWEFQTASRPALLATLVEPVYALNASAATHERLAAALFCLLSLIPVWVAFAWTGRLYGLRAAVGAGVMMGSWFELVYFAPKPTADAVCAPFFLAALFLARPAAGARGVFLGACALMLAAGIRLQILPAIVIALLLILALHGARRPVALALGSVAGLAIVGGIEWAWWGHPFQGHWGYLSMEFSRHASDLFGRQPVTFYAKNATLFYGGLLPIVIALVLAGGRRAPVLLLALVALALPFHFVGHKEYRFMMPAVPVAVLLMGLGAADVMRRFAPAASATTWAAIGCGWLIAMGAMAWSDSYRPFWFRDRNAILAFRAIGAEPDACGVALERIRWYHTPGYSGLGRDIPIYEAIDPDRIGTVAAAANYILAAPKTAPPPAPYVAWREFSRPVQYVYRRPGACVPDPAQKIERPPIPVSAP